MQRRIRCWLLLILFVPAIAAADGTEWYRAGIDAFQAEKYEDALSFFKQALSAGMDTPNLRYNLGASYYKTARYEAAEAQFQKLAQIPDWKPLALYNLGLTAEARGDREAAYHHYTSAYNVAAPDSRIYQRAALKCRELGPAAADESVRRWYGLISISAGYDDNAVMSPDNNLSRVSKKSDVFTDLYAFGGRYLRGDYSDGLRVDAAAYARFYADVSDYNFGMLFAGATRDKRYDKWHTRAGLGVYADFEDNGFYAATPTLQLALDRSVKDLRLRLVNALGWVAAENAYNYLTGIRNRTAVELRSPLKNSSIYSGYEVEYNNRKDLKDEGYFFSYSPLRHKVHAGITYPVSRKWRFDLRGEFRRSIYPDANREFTENGTTVRYKREDDRLSLSLQGEYRVADRFDIFAEYRLTDNESNAAAYSYTTHQVLLGFRKTF